MITCPAFSTWPSLGTCRLFGINESSERVFWIPFLHKSLSPPHTPVWILPTQFPETVLTKVTESQRAWIWLGENLTYSRGHRYSADINWGDVCNRKMFMKSIYLFLFDMTKGFSYTPLPFWQCPSQTYLPSVHKTHLKASSFVSLQVLQSSLFKINFHWYIIDLHCCLSSRGTAKGVS